MESIRAQLDRPLIVGIASFVAGILIGLIVLGWWLWPVNWTDAGPSDLRPEFQEIYLRMAIDSYRINQDPLQAQQHIKEVGSGAGAALQKIAANPGNQDLAVIQAFLTLSEAQGIKVPTPAVTAGPTGAVVIPGVTPTPSGGASGLVKSVLPIMCLITLLLAGGLVAVYLLRGRGLGTIRAPRREAARPQPQYVDYTAAGREPPISQFMTTYNLGNDLYDDSFSIDSPAGEFLGECGVGISETIGVGEPKKVTAFEVWLFDKNDIQTVTQVLMSQHAYADDTTRQRLATKGEPVPAEPGRELVLETATLRLAARVVDMSYGSGALPAESFFDRLTLEMVVWPK